MSKKSIAIDGPAGAGKSTIVKIVASKLNLNSVDSGSLYRLIAYCLKQNGMEIEDFLDMEDEEITGVLNLMNIEIKYDGDIQINVLNGEDLEDSLIRTEEMGQGASLVSTSQMVREKVTRICQDTAEKYDVIMEGRDIGTVVLPNAELKIYLDADIRERAIRRKNQYELQGKETKSLEEIEEDVRKRDQNDMTRKHSPLKKAEDATVLDTTGMTIEEVALDIVDKYNKMNK